MEKNYEEHTLKWSTNCHLQKKFTQCFGNLTSILLKFGQIHGWNGHVDHWKILDHIVNQYLDFDHNMFVDIYIETGFIECTNLRSKNHTCRLLNVILSIQSKIQPFYWVSDYLKKI